MDMTRHYVMLCLAAALLLHPAVALSREAGRVLTLPEVLVMAREHSVDAAEAANSWRSAYWRYRSFRAESLPELSFAGTIPSYNNSYNAYQDSDGSYSYVRNNIFGLSGALSVTQNIPLTGGSLSLSSSLDYNWQMAGADRNEFLAVPVSLTFTQPVFGVNTFRWNRKIEPVRYEEAKASYSQDMEQVNMEAVGLFFSCIMSRDNLAVARENLSSAEDILKVGKHRREIGQISETELMQLEISALEAKAQLTSCESSYKASLFSLCSYIGLEPRPVPDLEVPEDTPLMSLEYQDVLSKAMQNSPFMRSVTRRRLEAEYAVAAARGNLRRIDLSVKLGYSGADSEFADAYARMMGQQVVSVGVDIPLVDWGRRRGQVRVAESERDVVESQLRREEMEFGQDIFILVEQFNNQSGQLDIARRRDELAASRYASSVRAFMAGKMTALELDNAREAMVAARQNYVSALHLYWDCYYRIRFVTLWDYAEGRPLEDEKILDELR